MLSFIPPDGNFRLISYRVSSQKYVDASARNLPSYIRVMGRIHFTFFILTVEYLNASLLPLAMAQQETQEELVKIRI